MAEKIVEHKTYEHVPLTPETLRHEIIEALIALKNRREKARKHFGPKNTLIVTPKDVVNELKDRKQIHCDPVDVFKAIAMSAEAMATLVIDLERFGDANLNLQTPLYNF